MLDHRSCRYDVSQHLANDEGRFGPLLVMFFFKCREIRDLMPLHQDHQVVDPFGEGLTKVFFFRYELLESVGLFAGQPPPSPKTP